MFSFFMTQDEETFFDPFLEFCVNTAVLYFVFET